MEAGERRPDAAKAPPPSRREQTRTVAAFVLGGLGAVFALLNLDDVDVNWLFGTWSTPLIIVIAISFVLGAGVGFLVARRRAAGD
jgi:lipopolysaccharide assembly protein A